MIIKDIFIVITLIYIIISNIKNQEMINKNIDIINEYNDNLIEVKDMIEEYNEDLNEVIDIINDYNDKLNELIEEINEN